MTTFKFTTTETLEVGYQEWVPKKETRKGTIILLHGWPDSPDGWSKVGSRLSSHGYKVIAPALRGFGPTQFRSAETPRSGQLAALGRDLIELINALQLDRPILVGHDWGARAASNACALSPGIASHLVLVSVGYGTNSPHQSLTLKQARNYWYHWYMSTERGEQALRKNGQEFARMMWDTWSPEGWYTEQEFHEAAEAFENPDWPDIVLHSYRHRWGFAEGDPDYSEDEQMLDPAPVLSIPTMIIHGQEDNCNHPETSAEKDQFFEDFYHRALIPEVGHFPHREAPEKVLKLILWFIAETQNRSNLS